MSLRPMSNVDFKKRPCRHVEFSGPDPSTSVALHGWGYYSMSGQLLLDIDILHDNCFLQEGTGCGILDRGVDLHRLVGRRYHVSISIYKNFKFMPKSISFQ